MGWYGGPDCGCCDEKICFYCDSGTVPDEVSVTIAGVAQESTAECCICTDLNATFTAEALFAPYDPCTFYYLNIPVDCKDDTYSIRWIEYAQLRVWSGYPDWGPASPPTTPGWAGEILISLERQFWNGFFWVPAGGSSTKGFFFWESDETDQEFDCSTAETLTYDSTLSNHENDVGVCRVEPTAYDLCDFSTATMSITPVFNP